MSRKIDLIEIDLPEHGLLLDSVIDLSLLDPHEEEYEDPLASYRGELSRKNKKTERLSKIQAIAEKRQRG